MDFPLRLQSNQNNLSNAQPSPREVPLLCVQRHRGLRPDNRIFTSFIILFLSCLELELLWNREPTDSPEAQRSELQVFSRHHLPFRNKKLRDTVLSELEPLHLDSHFLVHPSPTNGGGLALLWKQEIDIQILESNQHFIECGFQQHPSSMVLLRYLTDKLYGISSHQ